MTDKVKEEIKMRIINPFSHQNFFGQYGSKSIDWIIFYGTPSCGNTFIAKALADESGAAFINVNINNLMSLWVGKSEKKITKIIDVEMDKSSLMIFFDDIETIGQSKDSIVAYNTSRSINQFLTFLERVDNVKEKILILTATNVPWLLDKALTSPGRLLKRIFPPPSDNEKRKHLYKIELDKKAMDNGISIKELATMIDGYSYAYISQICSEATQKVENKAIQSGSKRKKILNDIFI